MAAESYQPFSWREGATFAIRLLGFVVTLVVIGAFFLPWLKLDGATKIYSGAELTALVVSPMRDYIYAVAPIQTAVLIGCPAAIVLFATIVAAQYARRRTALFATAAVLACAIAIIYGTRDLVVGSELNDYRGLLLIVVLTVALLTQQLLIKLRTQLRQKRKLPALYRALSVATGSGHYRWSERDALN